LIQLSEEEHQAFLQAGRHSLMDFSILTNRNYRPNWHHEHLAQALERVERGEVKRLIVMMPPRHGKSQLTTINFPAWFLGKHPEKEVITASYASDLALDFGSKTRDLISDEIYQGVFPDVRLKEDERAKGRWMTNRKGTYTSVGVGGPITGRGAHLLIIDDPIKNREEAESDVIREKVWSWYTSTAYTRLEKDAAIIVILTRWHQDDLAGRLLEAEKAGGEHWEVVRYPAIATEDEEFRKTGEPLWSSKYDVQALNTIRKTVGLYDWTALYQQEPILSENQEFKQEWFRYFTDEDLPNEFDVYALVDLAISKEKTADNASVQVIAKNRLLPNIYKLEDLTGRLDPGQIIDYLFHLKAKYRGAFKRVGIESIAYQKALIFFLTEEMKQRQTYFDVVELKAEKRKEDRIRGLIPLYKTGVMFHRNTDTELENEFLAFPLGKHDDRIDAMAYLPQVLDNTRSSEAAKQFKPNFALKKAA
jgi:predicted phage terminase large subunit-like protein